MYLLDTDHLVVFQRRSEPEWVHLRAKLVACSPADFHLSIISFHEQILGAHTFLSRAKSRVAVVRGYEMLEQCLTDFGRFHVVSFDDSAYLEFERLRSMGVRIGTMDLRIACIALSHNMTLLTRNAVDFAQVPQLQLADWCRP